MKDNSRKGSKNKIPIHYGTEDYYRFYYQNYIKLKEDYYNVDKKIYLQILSDFNQEIMYAILDKGMDFKIPHQLGIIGLRKFKPIFKITDEGVVNKLPVDFQATKKLWRENPDAAEKKVLIRHSNKHTEGYVFMMHYFRNKGRFKNRQAYTISIQRKFKNIIAKRAKEGSLDAYLK